MTVWQPRYVLNVARTAGWSRDDAVSAAAMAVAATGGADHYVGNLTGAPADERRGLWAMTADEASPFSHNDLWTPAAAAKAAYSQWADQGGTWGWHPAWWGQTYPGALATVRAIADNTRQAPGPPPLGFSHQVARIKAVANELYHRAVQSG